MPQRAKGEGSIGLRADGTYYATLQVKGKRRWVYAKTKKEAIAKLIVLKGNLDGEAVPERLADDLLQERVRGAIAALEEIERELSARRAEADAKTR